MSNKKHGISTDPKLILDQAWVDMIKWPERDDGMLFRYILQVEAVEMENIGVCKHQKAYSYWMSFFRASMVHYLPIK